MGAAALPRTEITIARGTVALRQDELDRLLRALRELAGSAAADVAEEIAALRVAGVRIHLLPDAEGLQALSTALRAAEPVSRPGSGLTRLRALCED